MIQENQNLNTDNLINQMSRRIELADESFREFSKSKQEVDKQIEERKKEYKEKIKTIHEQIKEITNISKELRELVFSIGATLTDKVTKRDFEKFETKVNEYNFEDILHRQELERSFNRYAMKKEPKINENSQEESTHHIEQNQEE
jgi:hypothetical protein